MRARPGLAAIHGVDDGLVVTHGPAVFAVGEEHRGQHGARGHALRLAPGRALVVGEQHVAALAHGHQARARHRQVEQQRARRQRLDFRRLVGGVVGIDLRARAAAHERRATSMRPRPRLMRPHSSS